MCPLIKRLGGAFETLGRAFKTLGRTFERLRETQVLRFKKSSAACLCYNTAHAVPISHGNIDPAFLLINLNMHLTAESKQKLSFLRCLF